MLGPPVWKDIFWSDGIFLRTPWSSSPPLASEFSHEVLFTSMGFVLGVLTGCALKLQKPVLHKTNATKYTEINRSKILLSERRNTLHDERKTCRRSIATRYPDKVTWHPPGFTVRAEDRSWWYKNTKWISQRLSNPWRSPYYLISYNKSVEC